MFGAILLTHETARAQLETHAPKLPAEAREAVATALLYRATATVETGDEVRVYPNRSKYVIERLTAVGFVRVRGELSGVKRAASGHLYLALKDEGATRVVVVSDFLEDADWAGQLRRLSLHHDIVAVHFEVRAGDRVLTGRSYGVSPSTIFQAYYLLESRGLIMARARSGYFVCQHVQRPLPEPEISPRQADATEVDVDLSA